MNEDRASRFHRLRRRVTLASTALGVAVLVALLLTGASSNLAGWARGVTGRLSWPLRPALAVALYGGTLAMAWEVISLPFAFYGGFLLDRKYGLTSESVGTWLRDHAKAVALALVLGLGAALAI